MKLFFLSWALILSFTARIYPQVAKGLFFSLFLMLFVIATHGFLQATGYWNRSSSLALASGFYSNPAPYAGLLAVLVPLIIYSCIDLFKHQKHFFGKKYFKWLVLFLCLLMLYVVYLTKSRALLFGIFSSSILIISYHFSLIAKMAQFFKLRTRTVYILIGFVGILTLATLFSIRPASAIGRLIIWKIALTEMVSERPFFGHGIDYFKEHYNLHQGNYFKADNGSSFELLNISNSGIAFNEFIKIVSEEGIIGLFFFFAIIYFLIHRSSQFAKHHQEDTNIQCYIIACLACLISGISFAFFSYPFNSPMFCFLFFTIIGLLSSVDLQERNLKLSKSIKVLVVLGCLLICGKLAILNFDRNAAYKTWKNQVFTKTPEERFQSLKSIETYFDREGLFAIDYAASLHANGQTKLALDYLLKSRRHTSNPTLFLNIAYYANKLNLFDITESAYQKVLYISPHKFTPKRKLLQFYIEHQKINKAKILAKEILETPIKIASPQIDQIILEAKEVISK